VTLDVLLQAVRPKERKATNNKIKNLFPLKSELIEWMGINADNATSVTIAVIAHRRKKEDAQERLSLAMTSSYHFY
jgi:hypothetical protein